MFRALIHSFIKVLNYCVVCARLSHSSEVQITQTSPVSQHSFCPLLVLSDAQVGTEEKAKDLL